MTSIASSEWIGKSAMAVEDTFRPTLHLVYLPHLDYALQRVGPKGNIGRDLGEIDSLCGKLMDFFRSRGCRVIVLSEYGITQVDRPIHPNKVLRSAGYLRVKVDLGREYLDPGMCKAFAVSDHQIAHIYVRDRADIHPVRALFEGVPGVEQVLDDEGKRAHGLDHERSGEIVLISDARSWLTYYFWHDDDKAPDYARTVNIHAKPGYDPCELFLDPVLKAPKLKVGLTLLRKILGFRYQMEVIPLDATLVKGSHGRVTDREEEGPLFMTTEARLLQRDSVGGHEVFGFLLDHVFVD
jgi:predicted AlkP superfamily pyrophosphatase or phosphodiesterase